MNFDRSWGVTIGAAAVLVAVAGGAWYLRRQGPPTRATPARSDRAVDQIPERLPLPEKKTGGPTSRNDDQLPENTGPFPDLSEDKGRMATDMHRHLMKERELQLRKQVLGFGRSIGLPEERIGALKTLLDGEEARWRQDYERRLKPVFEGKRHPDRKFLEEGEYKSWIDQITADTDRQAATLLDGHQWKPYQEWRARFIRRFYFYEE